jgi:hypothetical protein
MFVNWGPNKEDLFYDYLAKDDVKVDELGPELLEMIMGDNTEAPPQEIMRFKKFLYEDVNPAFRPNHNYMINKFGLEIHFIMNKNPKANFKPSMSMNLVFGG